MSDPLTYFPPTLNAAHTRLDTFVPRAGAAYAAKRNYDFGAGRHTAVSTLSPYLRVKALDEITVARAVLDQHSAKEVDKYLTEVFWRTYWKGWLEQRPEVWDSYRNTLNTLQNEVQTQAGLRQRWQAACNGDTGIAPFDHWARELVATGYLHNHARMWFASIWVFTLELPWHLGADFFLRHLLDGDVAANTLGWRWVAGAQTVGKTYLATPDNIAKYTDGRFEDVTGLARSARAVDAPPNPAPRGVPLPAEFPLHGRVGLLTHSEDICPPEISAAADITAHGFLDATDAHSPWQMAPHVAQFRRTIAQDRAGVDLTMLTDAQGIADWVSRARIDTLLVPYAPVGPVQKALHSYMDRDDAVPVRQVQRALDATAWPLATKGFFPFKKHIPQLLEQFQAMRQLRLV